VDGFAGGFYCYPCRFGGFGFYPYGFTFSAFCYSAASASPAASATCYPYGFDGAYLLRGFGVFRRIWRLRVRVRVRLLLLGGFGFGFGGFGSVSEDYRRFRANFRIRGLTVPRVIIYNTANLLVRRVRAP
jgi:hypothetical protein